MIDSFFLIEQMDDTERNAELLNKIGKELGYICVRTFDEIRQNGDTGKCKDQRGIQRATTDCL